MGVRLTEIDNDAIIRLLGEWDVNTRTQLWDLLNELREHGYRHIIVDLAKVEHIDANSVALIVYTAKRIADEGRCLQVRGVAPSVRPTLDALEEQWGPWPVPLQARRRVG